MTEQTVNSIAPCFRLFAVPSRLTLHHRLSITYLMLGFFSSFSRCVVLALFIFLFIRHAAGKTKRTKRGNYMINFALL